MRTIVSSSIEYFYDMSTQAFEQYCQGKCSKQQYEYYILVLKAECKSNHKQEIVEAYNQSWHLRDKPYETAEKYYNETYGGEK